MKNMKKLLITGMSLMLLSSVGVQGVSARHVHYHHRRITRIMKHRHYRKHYSARHRRHSHKMRLNSAYETGQEPNKDDVSYNQLIHDINYDSNAKITKYRETVNNTIQDNLNKYNASQIDKILSYRATNYRNGYGFSPFLQNKLAIRYFNLTSPLNQSSKQDTSFDTQIRKYLIQDINHTRTSYGLNPLTVTNISQAIANYRAPKVQYAYNHLSDYINYPHNTSNPTDNWVHGVYNHTTGADYINAHHYLTSYWSANAGNWSPQLTEYGDGAPFNYSSNTPSDVANNIDNGIINHDNCQGNNNGHRVNELNPNDRHVGIGITYNPATQIGTFNEQFIN